MGCSGVIAVIWVLVGWVMGAGGSKEMGVLTGSGALIALPQHFLLGSPKACPPGELWKPDGSSLTPARLEVQKVGLQSLSAL